MAESKVNGVTPIQTFVDMLDASGRFMAELYDTDIITKEQERKARVINQHTRTMLGIIGMRNQTLKLTLASPESRAKLPELQNKPNE